MYLTNPIGMAKLSEYSDFSEKFELFEH